MNGETIADVDRHVDRVMVNVRTNGRDKASYEGGWALGTGSYIGETQGLLSVPVCPCCCKLIPATLPVMN